MRGVFQRDDAPGIGAVQMPSGRVLAGLDPFNFRLRRDPTGTAKPTAHGPSEMAEWSFK